MCDTSKVLCDWAEKEYRKIEKIKRENPNAEPYVDYYDPCEGCLNRIK